MENNLNFEDDPRFCIGSFSQISQLSQFAQITKNGKLTLAEIQKELILLRASTKISMDRIDFLLEQWEQLSGETNYGNTYGEENEE